MQPAEGLLGDVLRVVGAEQRREPDHPPEVRVEELVVRRRLDPDVTAPVLHAAGAPLVIRGTRAQPVSAVPVAPLARHRQGAGRARSEDDRRSHGEKTPG
ncbi:MAG: hypothetical protein M3P48_12020 [Actinomycetota bacterium]|nr:hypothetical protein [Actinomycetota bacterium]